jgi:hypothetical protein
MYKPSAYLVVTYFSTYLPKYGLFITKLVTKKSDINWVEIHPQLSNNGHSMDGVLVNAS